MAGGAGTAAVRKARQNGIAVVCGVGGGLVLRPVAWRSIPGNSLFTIAYGADTRAPGPRSRRRAAPAGTRSDAVGVAARLVRRARARGRGTRSARDLPAATASTDVSPLPCPPIRPRLASCACQFLDVRKTAFKLNSRNAECFCHDGHDDATPTQKSYT